MARRRGSGRGKSSVNSRKSAVENAREKLKDDPGGTRTLPSQNNMEAATTTTTTTTKHLNNKNKQLVNNQQRSLERRGAASATATSSSSNAHKKHNNTNLQQTYRLGESHIREHVKAPKLTAKQAKAAAKAAAAAAVAAAAEIAATERRDSSDKTDPLALNVEPKAKHATTSKREKMEQKTAAATTIVTATASSKNNNNSNNNNNNNSSSDNISNSLKKNYALSFSDNSSSTNNNNNIHNKNNTNNNNNVSNIKSDKNPSHTNSLANEATNAAAAAAANTVKPTTAASITTNTTAAVATAVAVETAAATWSNSKYLHKKFKRLASTNENDEAAAVEAANNLRTTSMSSASSASSPPPATVDVVARAQQTQQQVVAALVNGNHCTEHIAVAAVKSANIINHRQVELPAITAPVQITAPAYEHKFVATSVANNHSNNNHLKFNSSASSNNLVPRTTFSCSSNYAVSNTPTATTATMSSVDAQTPQQQQQQSSAFEPATGVQRSLPANMGQQQPLIVSTTSTEASGTKTGRHVCPYCQLNCTKPSVLQKHIRAHTNERPYPCEICGFAFKTKSNYYKHCRSRTHAARERGIELPADVDDGSFGGSDQEQDPDFSNSSSDMISRTASPLDESSISSPAMPYQHLQQLQQHQLSPAQVSSPTPSPSSLSSAKSAYLQQPASQQQQQQLPLGSPAAGTLPPTAAAISAAQSNSKTSTIAGTAIAHKQVIDYKPYKPKFHKAALYATAKETPVKTQQQLHQQPQQQQMSVATSAQYHHPSLSPSTQVKLNNHINTHQMQLQMQHQQQQQQQQMQQQHQAQQQHQQQPHLHQQHMQQLQPVSVNANVMPLAGSPLAAAGVYYLSQQPPQQNAAPQPTVVAATAPPLHPAAHLPQQYYNPVAAAAAAAAHQQAMAAFHMMTPQQQQQFHHQLQLQQHMQQQQQMQMQQHQQQQQVQAQVQQQHSPVLLKTQQQLQQRHQQQQPTATPTAQQANFQTQQPQQQSPLPYLANASTTVSNTSNMGSSNSNSNSTSTSTNSGLIHGNISAVAAAAASNGGVQLNKEFLTEHISKLISQNEAIVENKELLLQKKYPKMLNRSRSFNNANNSSNSYNNNNSANANNQNNTAGMITNNSANSSNSNSNATANSNNNLVPTNSNTTESANAKLAQAIVNKQQLQQQQQHQQQQQQQHQQHQQMHLQLQQQQHYQQFLQQQRLDEQQQQLQQQHVPLNGLSKHISTTKVIAAPPQQQYRMQPQPPTHAQPQQHTQPTQQHMPMSLQMQAQHFFKEATALPLLQSSAAAPSVNLPLNLSAKTKPNSEEQQAPPSTNAPAVTPRKRQSIEHQASSSSEASTSSAAAAKHAAPNNSIIKNLLLNARGLAVPTGEGEDAVYTCPLCLLQFRTAEDLQLHNSTYCQGASCSAPISPVSSPSYKYFRSNSISLNLPDLKNSLYLSQNPLSLASLAKLAWSQLKTKPSSLVLSRLSASHSKSSTKNNSASPVASTSAAAAATAAEHTLRLIDAPLPSPGPLLGKTPLVDSYNHSDRRKSEDVIITKMHEDRQFSGCSSIDNLPNKRLKYDINEHFQLNPTPTAKQSTQLRHNNTSNISNISGGDMQLLTLNSAPSSNSDLRKEERMKRFSSSGGSMIPISECNDIDMSPKMIRTPLLSGGCFQEVSPKSKDKETRVISMPITPKLGGLNLQSSGGTQHFQFPPINSITGFNPLTLPPMPTMTLSVSIGENRVIPYVPGIPGPNSLTPQLPPPPQHLQLPASPARRTISPNRKRNASPLLGSPKSLSTDIKALSPFGGVHNAPSEFSRMPPSPALRTVRNWTGLNAPSKQPQGTSNSLEVPKKSFNFQRIADNLSPRKPSAAANATASTTAPKSSPEVRHFNFDNIAKETDPNANRGLVALTPLHVDTNASNPPTSNATEEIVTAKKSKFLRPTSLPLKPGTFTPKRHHGITPNANTLPLISPETPRPSKACVQLYLNGHAYTYLGLKCSTKVFYCTVNLPQPSYVADIHKLSMYSVWQVCAENNPHPLGFKPKLVMSLYDSRQKTIYGSTMAGANKLTYALVISQQSVMTPFKDNQGQFYHHQLKQIAASNHTVVSSTEQQAKEASDSSAETRDRRDRDLAASTASSSCSSSQQQLLVGGYESHEDYTYIRGRGRGRYVCSECGIRCKKPSMLKKHIRTHTDVRPYTCKHCNFSFKTKGNLTKHMQSKTHYKKCIELGINPGPMPADGEFLEPDMEFDQQSSTSAGGRTSSIPGESDSEDYSDGETESSDTDDTKSRLQEHEAARCLLSLSMTPPIGQSTTTSPQVKNSDVYTYQQAHEIPTTALSLTASTSAPQSSISTAKRVITSFTSPKPPFDYQKQEQYYSNPEEAKPKRNPNATTTPNFESAPIDLTKPRAVEAASPASKPTTPLSNHIEPTIAGNPLKTQAQIHDVIFGASNNESGFLKTLISVSDKVRNSAAEGDAEHPKKMNENVLLQAYLTEQALQYTKIKQCQMSRSFIDGTSGAQSGAGTSTMTVAAANTPLTSATMPNIAYTNTIWSVASSASSIVTVSSASMTNTLVSSASVATTNHGMKETTNTDTVPTIEVDKTSESLQTPKIIISEPKLDAVVTTAAAAVAKSPTSSAPPAIINTNASSATATMLCKSSDEGEESECPSDQEPATSAAKSAATSNKTSSAPTKDTASSSSSSHNSNLPAAVHQPGTTDFSGVLSAPSRTIIVGEDGLKKSAHNEIQPVYPRAPIASDGRPVCTICSKSFQKQHQLVLHMNIHYMERKFKCEPCGVSFRTQGHLQKHERSEAHKNKVMMTSTFGVPTTSNPRPFECTDCKIAFRIHGHLAKHLRSKTHVQKLECLQKLPFGTYAEIERAGISLTEIDTSDCDNSLISLKLLAQKLIEKDPSKLSSYTTPSGMQALNDNNSNAGMASHDSASEDGFSAAASAAATAIASLDNDSATNTPRRGNSLSEDETITAGLNSLKRRLPAAASVGSFSNSEESDNQAEPEKRPRLDLASTGAGSAASPAASSTSNASN